MKATRRPSAHERLQQRQLLERAVASLKGGGLADAESALQAMLLRWPGHGDALQFLGLLRHRQGHGGQAIELLRKATAALPEEPGVWNNLGNVHAALHQWSQAETAYRASLALRPDFADALANLAHACMRQGRRDDAADLYRRALALVPGQGLWQHLLAACAPAPPARASDAYLQQVFDGAAATFDAHLGSLDYQAPQRVAAAVQRHGGPPQAALDIADLGCGTGLAAAALRPYARQLQGCDLSAGMLEQARRRDLYDRLVQQELVAFLDAAGAAAFDLLVCADTLIYIGDLAPVMAAAARALRPGGRLIFTIETLPEDDAQPVRLLPHGRFAHRADHVEAACAAAGLALIEREPFALRNEGGCGVPGWLGVAGR